ncbi:MAG: glycine-rich domain-containing protein, partial [Dehalococcoidia bacterium]
MKKLKRVSTAISPYLHRIATGSAPAGRKFLQISIVFLLFFACFFVVSLPQQVQAQETVTITTTGSGNFTVPARVYNITVEAWGAGGAGGGRTGSSGRGGGGGGGAYAKKTFIGLTPGSNISYYVAPTATGGTGDGASGAATWFSSNNASGLVAAGGSGGTTGGTGGAGGATASSYGDVKYAGGTGGTQDGTNSGGGGGGAGSGGAGGNANGGTAGTGTADFGGTGGAGRSSSGNGNAGSVYGGGGGGARRSSSGTYSGGNGAPGLIRITYTVTPLPDAPYLYASDGVNQIAFNNIRQNTTTPTFRVSATHVASFNRFQLELNTASNFTGTAYTQTFSGTYTSGTQYNLVASGLSPSLPTTDGVTYYVRVRASDDGGSSWGQWSTVNYPVWTFTYKSASGLPDWFQTTDAQFGLGTLVATVTTGSGSVRLSGINATGGTITEVGGYRIHTFTSSGTFNIISGAGNVEYLIVAGGGGGGGVRNTNTGGGGGGGAGGALTGNVSVSTGSYTVTVGSGGAGGVGGSSQGGSGGSSSFAGVSAAGGGGGASGYVTNDGVAGGSGGGGRMDGSGGSGTSGQGYAGGNGAGAGSDGYYGAGGGGGATATGANGYYNNNGGNGGNGLTSTISGSSVTYGGGGGGGAYETTGATGGSGGAGGGGSAPNSRGAGTSGTANRGGGGGGATGSSSGSAYSGGAGGSGFVIIRYPITGSTTGTITSPAIEFSWLPGVCSWGGVQVGVTTANNNSITVQVLNAVGSPISGKNVTIQNGGTYGSIDLSDITTTGNNATLYLRATLTNAGGGTPYLNDWSVTVNAKPTATASSNSPVCEGSTITLTGGPGGMTSYNWTGPGNWTSSAQNATRTGAATNMTGTYTLTVTNSSNCTASNTTSVVVNAKPSATASSNSPVCEGATIQLYGGPNGMTTYNWTGPGGFSSSAQNATRTGAATNMTGTYTLTVTNSSNCTASNTTAVTVNALPSCTITAPGAVCALSTGNTASVPSAGANSTYNWSITGGTITGGNNTTQITWTAGSGASANISVTVTNGNGCQCSNSQLVTINALPVATASSNTPVCEGSTITLTGGPGGMSSYNWTGPNGFNSTSQNATIPNATLAMAGNYTLTVTNSNGCTASNTTNVFVQNCPTDYYTDWVSYCNGTSIWRTRDFHDYYCLNGTCQEDVIPQSEFVENCPADYYTDWVSYCNGTSIWRTRDFHDYYCFNGTCQEDVIPQSQFVEDCPADYYTDWVSYCNGTSIWRTRDFHDYYCLNGTCQEDVIPESEFVEDCPADYYTDWVSYCNGTSIWRTR